MKKTFFFAIAMAMFFTACSVDEPEFKADSRTITFACQGFEMTPFGTRAELSADGKALTDLWILDYVDGSLAQQLHQVSTDAIPAGAATFNVIPTTWYYTLDYTTGLGVNATASQPITINIPSSEIGVTGEAVNVFGFSESGEFTTDVAVNCKTSDNNVLGAAAITDAPLMMNRTTEYSGQLFSSNGLTTVNLSTDWSDTYTMTW